MANLYDSIIYTFLYLLTLTLYLLTLLHWIKSYTFIWNCRIAKLLFSYESGLPFYFLHNLLCLFFFLIISPVLDIIFWAQDSCLDIYAGVLIHVIIVKATYLSSALKCIKNIKSINISITSLYKSSHLCLLVVIDKQCKLWVVIHHSCEYQRRAYLK